MKTKQLGLIHTSATLVPIFQQLCKAKLPGVEVFNMVDDSLIKDVIRRGELAPATARRVVQQVVSAEAAGADYIMVTCSSVGRAVEIYSVYPGLLEKRRRHEDVVAPDDDGDVTLLDRVDAHRQQRALLRRARAV